MPTTPEVIHQSTGCNLQNDGKRSKCTRYYTLHSCWWWWWKPHPEICRLSVKIIARHIKLSTTDCCLLLVGGETLRNARRYTDWLLSQPSDIILILALHVIKRVYNNTTTRSRATQKRSNFCCLIGHSCYLLNLLYEVRDGWMGGAANSTDVKMYKTAISKSIPQLPRNPSITHHTYNQNVKTSKNKFVAIAKW